MGDDDDNRWATFISALPSAWVPVAAAFGNASGIVEGKVEPDGTWQIDLTFGVSDLSDLVRAAPVTFTAVDSGQSWWLDQHLEDEGGVVVAAGARAIMSWNDNFAAGVTATLAIYASDERYEAALADAREAHAETYDEDQDEGDPDDEQSPW